jgi:hypothetical protein
MLMAWKNHAVSYARLILDKLKSSSPNFNRLYNDISKIQRLTRSGKKGCGHEKEVHLPSVEDEDTFYRKMPELWDGLQVPGQRMQKTHREFAWCLH